MPSPLKDGDSALAAEADVFRTKLLHLDRLGAADMLRKLRERSELLTVIDNVVVPALEALGRGWEDGDVALAQIYMAGRVCEQLVDQFLGIGGDVRRDHPRIAISVLRDHHVLGKRIVRAALLAAGYEVVDLGRSPLDQLAAYVLAEEPDILLISVLMLPSALQVRELRDRLDSKGSSARIIVGGAPFRFDDQLWREVGAHAMGRSATDAVSIVSRIARELE